MGDTPPEVTITPWDSGDPRVCLIPKVMRAGETQLYERIRTIHCANKKASHECSGRVTLDRNGMTLQCPLCGDARTVHARDRKEIPI